MTTPSLAISIGRSPSRLALLLIPLVFACFALSPTARAVSPAPDGGYPNGNTAEGENALFNLIQENGDNTAVGYNALSVGAPGQGVGSYNTAVGAYALMHTFGAVSNLGLSNTATGAFALYSNGGGCRNTATGYAALEGNDSGGDNTASGSQALSYNHTGSFNTATGVDALNRNTTGHHNTGNGHQSLFNNTTGSKNSANGVSSLFTNTAGHDNVAVGLASLQNNTIGSFNIAIGSNAGANLTTGSDNIVIDHLGVAGESNTMRIGGGKQTATFITGIRGVTTRMANAIPVLIDSAGQLGTTSSSRRFKKEIQPMDKASEAILALKPVTFHYKSDAGGTPQFGLIRRGSGQGESGLSRARRER